MFGQLFFTGVYISPNIELDNIVDKEQQPGQDQNDTLRDWTIIGTSAVSEKFNLRAVLSCVSVSDEECVLCRLSLNTPVMEED